MRDDPGAKDGTKDDGITASTARKSWIDINWSWYPNAPAPSHFEVVMFTGTDPSNTANYIRTPVMCLGSDRRLVTTFVPDSSLTINAAVRAVYD